LLTPTMRQKIQSLMLKDIVIKLFW
jgi:hypothetical protein